MASAPEREPHDKHVRRRVFLAKSSIDEISEVAAQLSDNLVAHDGGTAVLQKRMTDCTQTLMRHMLSLKEVVTQLAEEHAEMLEATRRARSALLHQDEGDERLERTLALLASQVEGYKEKLEALQQKDETGQANQKRLAAELDASHSSNRELEEKVGVLRQRVKELETLSLSLESRLDASQRLLQEYGAEMAVSEASMHVTQVKRLQERVEFELELARAIAGEREAERERERVKEEDRAQEEERESKAMQQRRADGVRSMNSVCGTRLSGGSIPKQQWAEAGEQMPEEGMLLTHHNSACGTDPTHRMGHDSHQPSLQGTDGERGNQQKPGAEEQLAKKVALSEPSVAVAVVASQGSSIQGPKCVRTAEKMLSILSTLARMLLTSVICNQTAISRLPTVRRLVLT